MYQEEKTFNIIKGQIPEFGSDIQLSYSIDGVKGTGAFPNKANNYSRATVACQNGVSALWNMKDWSLMNIHSNGNAKIKCTVNFITESLLNGVEPEINGDLIAVRFITSSKVYKVGEDNNNNLWYDYANKKWANAVILKDKTIIYNDGDEIPEENIESYFVWIPKYRYKLWNVESTASSSTALEKNPFTIDIIFGDYDTSDNIEGECENSQVSGANGKNDKCKNGDYMTHPAFTSLGVKGFWVGKFETGYNQNSDPDSLITDTSSWTAEGAKQNIGISANSQDKIIIKPNVYSWREQNLKNQFETAYYYKRDLDSHMMKSTEWGAVEILSHSIYGINDKIRPNNNIDYITGYSSVITVELGTIHGQIGTNLDLTMPYNTDSGVKASTTGNFSGVYDMSGGAYEYMASYVHGNLNTIYSGFEVETDISVDDYDKKYFDVYDSNSTSSSYQYRILGDATGEMGPHYPQNDVNNQNWYGNTSDFVDSSRPWFARGGTIDGGIRSGIFAFRRWTGDANYNMATRLVLTY